MVDFQRLRGIPLTSADHFVPEPDDDDFPLPSGDSPPDALARFRKEWHQLSAKDRNDLINDVARQVNLTPSADQHAAVLTLLAAIGDSTAPVTLTLAGPAGTGKTTVLRLLLACIDVIAAGEALNLVVGGAPPVPTEPLTPPDLILAAPTWKAASRLRALLKEGGTPRDVSSIHSAIYEPPKVEEEVKHVTDAKGAIVRQVTETLLFTDPIVQTTVAFFVTDEASMVNADMARDLRIAFPCAVIIGVGDPCQLPPVEGQAGFNLAAPTAMLDKVHRQAEGDPILRLATRQREFHTTPGTRVAQYARQENLRVVTLSLGGIARALAKAVVESKDPVALVTMNQTRVWLNHMTREHLNLAPYEDGVPAVGERVIALATNRTLGICNGETGVVVEVEDEGLMVEHASCRWMLVDFGADRVERVLVRSKDWKDHHPANAEALVAKAGKGVLARLGAPDRFWIAKVQGNARAGQGGGGGSQRSHIDACVEYAARGVQLAPAYAITIHKSQGSQYARGIIVAEWAGWLKGDEWRLWYTATTRFSEDVVFALLPDGRFN